MIAKVLSPLGFPLLFVVIGWIALRNQRADHKAARSKMRLWIVIASMIACGDYAIAWHNEIGSAWLNHPELTLFATLIAFAVFNAVAPPLDSLTMSFNNGPLQHSEKKTL
jgi:cytochrome bd-type quinol oxidase subunit 2